MKTSILNLRIFILFAMALLIVGVVSGLLYLSFVRLKAEQEWVDHTYSVINEVQNVLSNLKDVQSSQRGYVITGQETYLEPYKAAVPLIDASMKKLAVMLKDNPIQQEHLKELELKTQHRLDVANEIITTYRTKGQQSAFDLIIKGLGKVQMDEVRALVRDMVKEEEVLLRVRQDHVNHTTENTLWLGAGGLLACITIIFSVFLIMHRETLRRASIESSLQHAFRQMQDISHENEVLSRMNDYFQSCKSPEEAFEIIAVNIQHLLPGTHGTIATFNNSRNIIETKLFWGQKSGSLNEYHSDDCWALRRGRIHHVHADSIEPKCHHVTGNDKGGNLCIPMQAHGDIIGTFFIGAHDEKDLDDHKRQIAQNISEQVSLALANLKLQEKLRQQSIRDPMTNLYNRRYMEETMEREINRATKNNTPLHVLMLDIDHFKRFNDTFGHDAGDLLIIEFAKLIQKNIRREDIACRYGGEEFLVMLPGLEKNEAISWAKQLGDEVRQLRIESNGRALSQITISMGLATFPEHGRAPAQLMHNADVGLYAAKKSGRDQLIVYDPQLQEKDPPPKA